jgi:hypothetical protein
MTATRTLTSGCFSAITDLAVHVLSVLDHLTGEPAVVSTGGTWLCADQLIGDELMHFARHLTWARA